MALPKLEDLPAGFEVFQMDKPRRDRPFDLMVFDIQAFQTWQELKEAYFSLNRPTTLLIVDTVEEESAALAWLEAKDDICRRDAIQPQLCLRLKRRQKLHNWPSTSLDYLTQIANRHTLCEHIERFVAANESGETLRLIFLDVDRFKSINDTYGHAIGDEILQELGQLLRKYARGVEIVGRYGGDEFAIALRGNLAQGKAFAEFLRTQIASHLFCADSSHPVRISASFGVAATNGDLSLEELWREADRCLYAAKEGGRNCTVTEEEFHTSVDAVGQDIQIATFENKIRVMAERMTEALLLNARQLAKQYRTEANVDGLTEVFNRRYFDRLLPRQLEEFRQQDKSLALAFLDLDHFGEVNKTYGFPTGDRALKAAIEAARGCTRETDWIARYGGEEFCVVMPNTALLAGLKVAQRIRQTLKEQTIEAYDGRKFQITVSIGVVELLPEDADLVALCQRASNKVREAKQGGRDRVCS